MTATATDAVVIGGGHNGLAAAVHLARSGMSVAVVEAADVVGGAVKTAEMTLPGFRHDLYAMNLSLFAGSPFAKRYGEALAEHGLEYAPAHDCFSSPFPDGRWLGVSQDLDTNADRIAAFSERDAQSWRDMSAAFGDDAPHYFALLGSPMKGAVLARLLMRTVRQRGRAFAMDAVRLLLSSPRDFLDAHFETPEVKAMLAPWAMHLDFPPDASGGALFPYLEAMADQAFGLVIGKGGADVIPKSLVSLLEDAGGSVRTGVRAVGIEKSAGRAIAVRLADGEVMMAKEAILASLTPSGLLTLLEGSTGKPAIDRRLRAFKHAPGTMMIHLATNALPPWTAGDALQKFAYVHLAPNLSTLSAAYASAVDGELPAAPSVVVGQPTAIDPSRAPEGKHVLWLQVRCVPGHVRRDALGVIAPGPWPQIKEAMADRVMEIVEEYAPGFSETVLARTVQGPDDLEADNANLVGGDSLGGSHHLRQNFLFRPVQGMARYKTPVRGLYMIGSSTWPGAGVGAGSGYLAAQSILRH